jgi:hypothetical protein
MENTQDITALRYIVCTDKGVETTNYQMMVRGLPGVIHPQNKLILWLCSHEYHAPSSIQRKL